LHLETDVKTLDMPVHAFLERHVERIEWSKNVAIMQLDDLFSEALQRMVDHHTNRVFIVDDDKQPIGIVTLKEVLWVTIGSPAAKKATMMGRVSDRYGIYTAPGGEHQRTFSKASGDAMKALCAAHMSQASPIISKAHLRNIWMNLRAKVRNHDWRLLFSAEDHGYSLASLYRHCARTEEPCVLVIQDLVPTWTHLWLLHRLHLEE